MLENQSLFENLADGHVFLCRRPRNEPLGFCLLDPEVFTSEPVVRLHPSLLYLRPSQHVNDDQCAVVEEGVVEQR